MCSNWVSSSCTKSLVRTLCFLSATVANSSSKPYSSTNVTSPSPSLTPTLSELTCPLGWSLTLRWRSCNPSNFRKYRRQRPSDRANDESRRFRSQQPGRTHSNFRRVKARENHPHGSANMALGPCEEPRQNRALSSRQVEYLTRTRAGKIRVPSSVTPASPSKWISRSRGKPARKYKPPSVTPLHS